MYLASQRVMDPFSRIPRRINTADLVGALAADAFRVPMEWCDAQVLLADGSAHAVRLSMRRAASVHELLEAREPFLPVRIGDEFRLYARTALACITTRSAEPVLQDGDLPLTTRQLRVHLLSGVTLEGCLRFVWIAGRARSTDVLNDEATSFALQHDDGSISHVFKAHVLCVQELG
jgi:hypothetical protein